MYEVHHPMLFEPVTFTTFEQAQQYVIDRTELSGAVIVEVLELPFGEA